MDLVWDSRLGASRKLVALSYANSAHDEDARAWASIPYLERRTGLDRKTIMDAIAALELAGILTDTGERRGQTRRIKVYMVTVPETEQFNSPENGIASQVNSPEIPMKQSRFSQEIVPFFPGNSPENGTQRRTVNVPETSNETSSAQQKPAAPHKINGAVKDQSPVLAKLPLRGGGEFEIRGAFMAELSELYPGVDVPDTLREMRGWCAGNPDRIKTRKGIRRFITHWLQNEQEKYDNEA